MRTLLAISVALAALAPSAHADRIKDLTTIGGVRDNHLTGFGIVIGLDGTGDDARSPLVKSALQKMLKKLGVSIDANDMKSKNVAAVMITAELPPFAKPGMALDITVSSMGNAKSLLGGTLLAAPLKGADQRTWAIAQGALSVGGFAADASSGSSAKKNHTLAGTIPRGAIVEASAPTEMPRHEVALILKQPDFTTATRMREAIGKALGAPDRARLVDSATVTVSIPKGVEASTLIAQLEAIDVEPDVRAKVVVDEKTGTVVIGEAVTLRTAAITFGSLTVEIAETPIASQPDAPLGKGTTKVLPRSDIKVNEDHQPMRVIGKAATVGDVSAALAALGAKPRDLVAILRALRAAGALRADLETM
ncbi:MAG: flagellar basal body P-ring protein FlgI [Deltaproteobacteria bacterium]|nr:flagellar basal body P-ring protein FlgI [Deltaproteobacteria bacterium]